MTGRRTWLLIAVLTVGVTSCADPSRSEPVAKPTAPAVKQPRPPAAETPTAAITEISMPDLFALQQTGRVMLLDARPSFFYSLGRIEGAISMPKGGSVAHIQQRKAEIKAALTAGKTIVVYCTNSSCPDARSVAVNLAGAGFPSSIMRGGYESWKESGLPVE